MASRWHKKNATWAAGSYVTIFNMSAFMQIFWILGITILYFTDIEGFHHLGNTQIISNAHYLGILFSVTLGVFMMLPVGIAYDTFPLIHAIAPFDETIMKVFIWTNSFGQICFMLSLFASSPQIQHDVGLIAITLIAISLTILAPAILRTVKMRTRKSSGPLWHYTAGLTIPVIAMFSLAAWMMQDYTIILHLATVLLVDIFWLLLIINLIIGHFNRRLGWELISEKRQKIMPLIFTTAIIIHLIMSVGEAAQSSWWHYSFRLSFSLLLLVALATVNPVRILRMAWVEKRPNSDLLILSLLWLGIAFIVSLYEILVLKRVTNVSRVILFFGAGVQGTWGFASYLHLDHIGTKIQERAPAKKIRRLLNVSLLLYLAIYLPPIDKLQNEMGPLHFLMYLLSLLAFISSFIWWISNSFFSLNDWHRVPIFYKDLVVEYDDLDE